MNFTYNGVTYERELIASLASELDTVSKILKKLGIKIGGRSHRGLKAYLAEQGIELQSFVPHNYVPDEEVFIENSPYINNRILVKDRYLAMGYENICAECGLGPEWNGKKLVLQLDHINGKNNDHRVENLRILCPNCHTQTDTYCGKNRPKTSSES